MSSEFWLVFIVLAVLAVLASWLLLMSQPVADDEPPTLNTRNDLDDR